MKKLILSAVMGIALVSTTAFPVQAATSSVKKHKHHKTAKRVGVGAVGGAAVGALAGGGTGAAVGAAAGAGAGAAYDHHEKKLGK
jgi:hypothetical protein